MTIKGKLLRSGILMIMLLMISGNIFSQTPANPQQMPQAPDPSTYTDDQLKTFASVVLDVMAIQEENQAKMMKVIQDNNLSLERFNEMVSEGQQKGQDQITATEEEMQAFQASMGEVQQIQMDMNNEMMTTVTESDLNVQQYRQMMMGYEQDPDMRKKVDKYIDESMGLPAE